MKKSRVLLVRDKPVAIGEVNQADYLNLVHLVAAWDGSEEEASQVVIQWIRTRNTLDYLAAWEGLYGARENFQGSVYADYAAEAGKNGFVMSPQRWVETTHAIGIEVKRGRNGGVFAHKDIALEFCTWLNPVFKLYVVREFDRLKQAEQHTLDPEWTVRRVLAANSWRIQTDAVRDYELPRRNLPQNMEGIAYADEAETLNVALFHITSKQWRLENPTLALQNKNLRDYATINELIVLSNLEGLNALLIKENNPREERIKYLANVAAEQLKSLSTVDTRKSMAAAQKKAQQLSPAKPANAFDASLKGLLAIPPPPKPSKRAKGGKQEPPQYNDPE